MTWAQLRALGVAESTIGRWTRSGYLYRVLPRVYAVGHAGRSEQSDLFAAVLYAGPGAALGGMSAGLWRGLVKWRTAPAIEVVTPRRRAALSADHETNRLGRPVLPRVRRRVARSFYHGIPTVPTNQLVVDLAAAGDVELVRFVLAQLDFMRRLNLPALEGVCGRGVPGSAVLREAIACHQPLLARARSPFEVRLLRVCELTGIPLPEVNIKVAGVTPDAIWRDQMVVVECDGEDNHNTWRQRRRDAGNDLILRGLGFLPIRYTYDQLDDPRAVHDDLMPILEERRGRARRTMSA